ncbi:MAG: cellulase family glycosylhydrolase [Erysipelotrichaceae bacterium]|nr:cellulase family glycosylhydrolase [Erysipelotrichaceae bacterium]
MSFYVQAEDEETAIESHDARPSVDGHLSVENTHLVNETGEIVTLRGISTHGLTWYPDYINENLFRDLSENWNCNIIRLAMYSTDYVINRKENLEILYRGIEAAINADMYVLVDWHILDDYDPLINVKQAEVFFEEITKKYGNIPNLIYEICNEPNRDCTWDSVYEYAEIIIPIIRSNSPDSVIVVGTPEYDQDIESPLLKRIEDENVMYVFHFYTASHYEMMRKKLSGAIDAGLPVFISECGITEADGNGKIDYDNACIWFDYLHSHNIPYIIWNLSNKDESSSFIKASSNEISHLEDEDLTHVGKWVRSLLLNKDPHVIVDDGTIQKYTFVERLLIYVNSLGSKGIVSTKTWPKIAASCLLLTLMAYTAIFFLQKKMKEKFRTYDDFVKDIEPSKEEVKQKLISIAVILLSSLFTLIYLVWRIFFSISVRSGFIALIANIALLIVELFGFVETAIHYFSLTQIRKHPLPAIEEDEYPDVDIFIATYNEPCDLLRRTINGCKHLHYPDPSKVHIWVCDDNRRKEMRQLAKKMKVGYFDRPDNKGAKAGNLNHAMSLTSSPYVVTLDADMIVRSDFLMKTVPYFVDFEKRNEGLKEDEKVHLGLLQTPQCFYDPDVFQHALYSENRIPNEQDFFYRSIEVAKTSTNSVIYGGSNTVLSRKAIEAIGGFYTESITEDFATGLLIEAEGFVSLGLGEPLASGRAPHTFKEHIQQRTRWGRGVIVTGKKLDIFKRKDLSIFQKLSYWSSVVYWYSPIKNLIYVLSPLLFAAFNIPVIRCNWLELLVYWLPMFLLQDLCLRVVSGNTVSTKWSGIYETSVMPHLLIPIIKESLGITLSKFLVTDKTKKEVRKTDLKMMAPFIILILLSVFGIFRVLTLLKKQNPMSMIVILFWLLRNLYFLVMALFLIDGRDSDSEVVKVKDAELITVTKEVKDKKYSFYGITTLLTEHSIRMMLDESQDLKVGDNVEIQFEKGEYRVRLKGVVIDVIQSRFNEQRVHTVEILDFGKKELEYFQILYDRVPTLPQSLSRDLGVLPYLWRNIVERAARAGRI